MNLLNIDEEYLDKHLFNYEKSKKINGPTTFMSINYLPNLFHYLKNELTPLENSSISDYELQNLLIEMSFIDFHFEDIISLKKYILLELKTQSKYWIQQSHVFNQISEKLEPNFNANTKEAKENMEKINQYVNYHKEINKFKINYEFVKQETEENLRFFEENSIDKKSEDFEEEIQNFEEVVEDESRRVTRGQRKKGLKIRKKKKNFNSNIFIVNEFKKIKKLEMQILPYIFNYFMNKNKNYSFKENFKFQNFILFLLTDNIGQKKNIKIKSLIEDEDLKVIFSFIISY